MMIPPISNATYNTMSTAYTIFMIVSGLFYYEYIFKTNL
jgi:hypothetical protein